MKEKNNPTEFATWQGQQAHVATRVQKALHQSQVSREENQDECQVLLLPQLLLHQLHGAMRIMIVPAGVLYEAARASDVLVHAASLPMVLCQAYRGSPAIAFL